MFILVMCVCVCVYVCMCVYVCVCVCVFLGGTVSLEACFAALEVASSIHYLYFHTLMYGSTSNVNICHFQLCI